MTPLAGRIALVTGASRGIGLAVADALYGAGAHVVRVARTLHSGRSDRRTDVPCDLRDEARVRSALAAIRDFPGVPDIVVNNAGGFLLRPLVETSIGEFREQVTVNLTAPFIVVRELLPALLARGSGHIVTIGSVADRTALPGNAAYGATKWGLRGLHGVLAAELEGSGLRVTLVSPGPTDTALWDPFDPDARPDLPDRAAMLRPQDVADAVLFAVTREPRVTVSEIRLGPG